MPVDFDKLTAEDFESTISRLRTELDTFKIGDEKYRFNMEFSISLVRYLTGRLNAIAHVKPNPHEWETRYSAEKAEIEKGDFYTAVYGKSDIVLVDGEKIPELSANSFNKAYNYMNPNIRLGENIKVRDNIPIMENGDKITINNILKGFPDILKIKQWVDANFNRYFDSNKMCIMPCQIGCQVGCEIAQQLPSDYGTDSCSIYPSGLGINGLHYAYPGRYYDWYPSWNTDKIHAVNSNLDQDEGPTVAHPGYIYWNERTHDDGRKRFTNIFGAATKEIRDKVREYNKEREKFNRAQIGKNPCVWKPYYSIIWLSFVLPISEEWLDSDKVIEESLARDRNGAHNYYRDMPKHASWSRNGRYLFVKCENDYLITPNTDNRFEKYQANYYEYIKYPARNDRYRWPDNERLILDCETCNNK